MAIHDKLRAERIQLEKREEQVYRDILAACPYHVGQVIRLKNRASPPLVILKISNWWHGDNGRLVDYYATCAPRNLNGKIGKYGHTEQLLGDYWEVIDQVVVENAHPDRPGRGARG